MTEFAYASLPIGHHWIKSVNGNEALCTKCSQYLRKKVNRSIYGGPIGEDWLSETGIEKCAKKIEKNLMQKALK